MNAYLGSETFIFSFLQLRLKLLKSNNSNFTVFGDEAGKYSNTFSLIGEPTMVLLLSEHTEITAAV